MSPLSIPATMRPARACAILLLSTLIGGCASANLNQTVSSVGGSAAPDAFQGARLAPFNAREHMATSLFLLERAAGRPAEIELAKSGFQTAARLAPDMWEPLVGLAACQYRLGEYSEALATLAQAVERRGSVGDLATPLALVAYRAHRPGLARLAFSAAPVGEGPDQAFLTHAFGQSGAWKPDATPPSLVPVQVRPLAAALVHPPMPTAAVTKPEGQAKATKPVAAADAAKPDAAPEAEAEAAKPAVSPDSDRNVLIEAFMIRDERTATSASGLNLLDSLALSFAGTVVNLNHELDRNHRREQPAGYPAQRDLFAQSCVEGHVAGGARGEPGGDRAPRENIEVPRGRFDPDHPIGQRRSTDRQGRWTDAPSNAGSDRAGLCRPDGGA